jgi:hypothetical protein
VRIGLLWNQRYRSFHAPEHSEGRFMLWLARALEAIGADCEWLVDAETPVDDNAGLHFPITPWDVASVDVIFGVYPHADRDMHPTAPFVSFFHDIDMDQGLLEAAPALVAWTQRASVLMSNSLATRGITTPVYQWSPGIAPWETEIEPWWDMFCIARPMHVPTADAPCHRTERLIEFIRQRCGRGNKVWVASTGYLEMSDVGWQLLDELHRIDGCHVSGRLPYHVLRSALAASPVYFDPLTHTPYFAPAEAICVGDCRVVRPSFDSGIVDEELEGNPYTVRSKNGGFDAEEMEHWHKTFERAYWNADADRYAIVQEQVRSRFHFDNAVPKLGDIVTKIGERL